MNSTEMIKTACFGLKMLLFKPTKAVVITAVGVSICNALFSITAILGNGLMLFLLATKPRLRCPSNVLIASLCITDFLVGLIVQPLHILFTVNEIHDKHLCNVKLIYSYFAYLCGGASYLNISLISIDRWYAVCHPFRYVTKTTMKKYIISVVIVWFSWAIMTLLPFIDAIPLRMFNIVLLVTGVFGMVIISTCYYFIHKVAKDHKQKISASISFAIPPSVSFAISPSRSRVAMLREKWKSNAIAIVVVALLICYFPYTICNLLGVFLDRNIALSYIAWNWTSLLVFINSSLNPVLYSTGNRDIRLAVAHEFRQRISLFHSKIVPK